MNFISLKKKKKKQTNKHFNLKRLYDTFVRFSFVFCLFGKRQKRTRVSYFYGSYVNPFNYYSLYIYIYIYNRNFETFTIFHVNILNLYFFRLRSIYLSIYIYIIKAFEVSTIFHVSILNLYFFKLK